MNHRKRTVADLPRELLLEIFGRLALQDRVAARAVCQEWRNLSGATGPVVVPGTLDRTPAKLRRYLEQMGATPLLYDGTLGLIESDDSTVSELARIVGDHMWHTILLDIQIICDLHVPRHLHAAVAQSAPLLQRLRLEFDMGTDLEDVVLFNHEAPRLDYCAVHACGTIIPAIAPFQTIRVLVLHGLVLYYDVILIFREFPALKELALVFDMLDEDLGDEVQPPLKPPTSLQRLTLASESDDTADLEPLLAWIQHELVTTVSVRHYKDNWRSTPCKENVARMLELLALPAAETLTLSCAPSECALRLLGSDGRARVHAGLYRETFSEMLKTAPWPAEATNLVVSGLHVLYTPDLLPSLDRFKAVRSLVFILRSLSPEDEPFSAALGIPPIYCPALETVTLGITQADYNRVGRVLLTAKDVREFLRDKLREDLRGKFKSLCLHGVSVEDISVLEPLADEVCVRAYVPVLGLVYPEDDLRRYDGDYLWN